MSGRRFVLVVTILAALLLSGCGAGESGLTTDPETASPQPATGVPPGTGDIESTGPMLSQPQIPATKAFAGSEILSQGQNLRYSSPEPLFQVIITQQALNSFWQAYLPGTPLPAVDFGRSFVLAGIQGVRSTGGYGISFTGLEQDGDEVRVITDWTEPGCSDSVDMGFTQPYTVLRVDSSLLIDSGALIFLFETETGRNLSRVSATIP